MKIHEYQAKELFRAYQIPTPEGHVAFSLAEAENAAAALDEYPQVVKAQIHAGGRGKAGGIRVASSSKELRQAAADILGMKLINNQTGPEGKIVGKVLIEKGLTIKHELYLSILPDRATSSIVIIASTAGGMDIEEVAASRPEKIIKVHVNPLTGLQPYHCREAGFGLGLKGDELKQFMKLLDNLFTLFCAYDCMLVEINPLVITDDNRLIALDAKVEIDSSSLFRHTDIRDMQDESEMDPLEVDAQIHGLNYIRLEGSIGNMVNGAGLAMATMDIIKQAGAEPANFLDVGGGASAEMVEAGFKIMLSDPNVKGILINIFGGILRCDVLAEGVIQAANAIGVNVPVVVRMEGTNAEEGRRILSESGLSLISATDLADAAERVAQIGR
ncbi:MAG: ADP-forming succinate--CoA ligase subunit beta [Desulfobulbaceae bacterium]|uniref:Succinate--CoA ligase [ADP-forming] subunit beta n=1 Tax=Candidatus Desulfobia pelagia TaxID=2841692 RepID=A0A8J6NCS7_9BACT|nr:ADP-forming succinate--CoA ligase subunit beta [Candidatus Desulfobia pelagia]